MNNKTELPRRTLEMKGVSFKYPRGRRMILKDVSAFFESGRLYTVEGESGAGKSTLLTLLSGLARPTSGEILADGARISEMGLTRYRREIAATVAQANLLFEGRTVLENVMFPMLLKGTAPAEAEARAKEYLRQVKLDEELCGHFPKECSGGEQKRAAFARAMALDNPVILADEPTANLDRATARTVASILGDLAKERGRLVIAVTHEAEIPEIADERLFLRAGVLERE